MGQTSFLFFEWLGLSFDFLVLRSFCMVLVLLSSLLIFFVSLLIFCRPSTDHYFTPGVSSEEPPSHLVLSSGPLPPRGPLTLTLLHPEFVTNFYYSCRPAFLTASASLTRYTAESIGPLISLVYFSFLWT